MLTKYFWGKGKKYSLFISFEAYLMVDWENPLLKFINTEKLYWYQAFTINDIKKKNTCRELFMR